MRSEQIDSHWWVLGKKRSEGFTWGFVRGFVVPLSPHLRREIIDGSVTQKMSQKLKNIIGAWTWHMP
jgi:hypothetical protein